MLDIRKNHPPHGYVAVKGRVKDFPVALHIGKSGGTGASIKNITGTVAAQLFRYEPGAGEFNTVGKGKSAKKVRITDPVHTPDLYVKTHFKDDAGNVLGEETVIFSSTLLK